VLRWRVGKPHAASFHPDYEPDLNFKKAKSGKQFVFQTPFHHVGRANTESSDCHQIVTVCNLTQLPLSQKLLHYDLTLCCHCDAQEAAAARSIGRYTAETTAEILAERVEPLVDRRAVAVWHLRRHLGVANYPCD
jgi:hypothetical protein